jgi:multicomponent Na+:H+ antiporter subunit A
MLLSILAGILLSVFVAFLPERKFLRLTPVLSLLPLSLFVYFCSFIPTIISGSSIHFNYEWVSSLGINLTFHLDALGLLFALIISGIGTLVYYYSSYYMKDYHGQRRFYGFLSLFMAAMLGLVLSENIITLFIFWEMTSISSFFLIGFNQKEQASRRSALVALSITGLGGMFLLGFAVFAGIHTETWNISAMLEHSAIFSEGWLGTTLLVLLLVAAFTKSAQFPFHFWLPGAMKAPTPVSTYLHSATMVKAGIYLLLRFAPHFSEHSFFHETLLIFGAVTMLYAAYHTLFRTDLKSILAYSTISALGVLVFLIGVNTAYSIMAAYVFILVHALYKASLFLITGIIDHQTGTRDVSKLRGLYAKMRPVGIAAFIAAISSAGIPPLIGFVGKDLIYEGTLHHSQDVLLTTLALITNVLIGYAGFAAGIKPFIGKTLPSLENVKAPAKTLWLPPVFLAILSIIFGLFPGWIGSLLYPAVAASGFPSPSELKLWHGFNLVLALSFVTILSAILLFVFWKAEAKKERFIERFNVVSPANLLQQCVILFEWLAKRYTVLIQNGYLRKYVAVMMLIFAIIMGVHVATSPFNFINFSQMQSIQWNDAAVVAIMFVAILFCVFAKSRLAAIAGLGIVGYCMCFIFVFYSAPDLAMTQFTIDTLTVILFVLVLYRLPRYLKMSNTLNRIKDGGIALFLGAMVTLMVLEVMNETPDKSISTFYAEQSYLLAKGKNVVNVILVDFRGFDTFIEVIVLAIAAIGVFGLLKLHLKRNEK